MRLYRYSLNEWQKLSKSFADQPDVGVFATLTGLDPSEWNCALSPKATEFH